jgi:signal transduction histidine kinase
VDPRRESFRPMRMSDPAASTASAGQVPAHPGVPSGEASLRSVHLRALSRVTAALCGLSDLQAILRVGLDSITDLLQGAVGGILLVDERTNTLRYRIAHGLPPQAMKDISLVPGQGIAGRVVDTGRAIVLEDVSLDSDTTVADAAEAEFGLQGLRALASIPLRSRLRALGAIHVASREPRSFGGDELCVLHSIGEQMGVAIERAEVLEQLTQGRETYQRLARHYLAAVDEERRRIARELHDETSQSISALALNMRALVEMAEMLDQDQGVIERMRKVESMAEQTAHELSRITNDLRPALLDSAGLLPAIRRFAEDILQPLDIDILIEVHGTLPRFAPEVEATLYRFAQGAISNVARHAQARKLTIRMDCDPQRLSLSIGDDGRGFDASTITGIDETSGRGRGFFAMKERIRLLGGCCRVESAFGEGTTVVAELPLKDIGNGQDTSPDS